jgi:vacuole morphology and inheritance protein 14
MDYCEFHIWILVIFVHKLIRWVPLIRKYLSDPNPDVKIATENVLADFLREIKRIAKLQSQQRYPSVPATGRSGYGYSHTRRTSDVQGGSSGYPLRRRGSKLTMNTDVSEMDSMYTGTGATTGDANGIDSIASPDLGQLDDLREEEDEDEERARHRHGGDKDGDISMMTSQELDDEDDDDIEEHGAWIPGQGVYVDHTAIVDIMVQHLSYPGK